MINVQAYTALHLMDRQPERARQALTAINDVSKQALVELRSVLGVLRDVDETAPRAPSPGLARLGDLVASAAAAGLTVHLEEDGPLAPLPADVDLAAYRIVQEALTNSARDACGAVVTVRVRSAADALIVEVTDDGAGHPAGRGASPDSRAGGSGNGLTGMAERAAALGGTLQAGPEPGGGSMPVLDGIEATRRIAANPETAVHVVIVTTFGLDEYVFEGLRAGAAGFLVKDTDAAELIRADAARVMTKLAARDRAQLVVFAYGAGLVRPN